MADSVKRVAVVSTLPAVRAGLRALVEAGRTYEVVTELPSPAQLAGVESVDALVLDAGPGADARDIPSASVAAAVVILGPLESEQHLATMLDRPFALLPRDASGEQLRAALDATTQGLFVLDASAAERLLTASPSSSLSHAAAEADSAEHLTPREREVLQLVAEGLPNKTIARRLSISDHTVKFHVAAVLTKLHAASRTEAVHQATRRGLITL